MLELIKVFKKNSEIFLDIIFLFLMVFSIAIIKNEFFITLSTLILILIFFKIKYYDNELRLLIIGVFVGVVLELGGDLIYKLQYWNNASFFGIPVWLPIIWGFGFVIIRRIGNFIVKP